MFNLLKGWLEKGFDEDFKDDPEMLDTLHGFIDRMTADGLPKQAERLQETLQKKVRVDMHVINIPYIVRLLNDLC